MRKIVLLSACAMLLASGLYLGMRSASARGAGAQGMSDVVFARRIAGTWLFYNETYPAGGSFQGVVNMHTDGTVLATNRTDFGGGDAALNGVRGSEPGAWLRTGPRSFRATEWKMVYDWDDNEDVGDPPNGTMSYLLKVNIDGTLNEDYTEFVAQVTVYGFIVDFSDPDQAFLGGMDPNVDIGIPIPGFTPEDEVIITGRRASVDLETLPE